MLFRFSIYGFLKNQRYFEAFLILALLDKGLDFFAIGSLIALRELVVTAAEVPSGAMADVWGRRLTLCASLGAYIMSFVVFFGAEHLFMLGLAMVLYGIGDAFRTGTHKAMIFAWLRSQGREDERTQVYGYTRSWSKFGSALAVIVGAVVVLGTGRYDVLFLLSAGPYLVGIVNIASYPGVVEGERGGRVPTGGMMRHFVESFISVVRGSTLRGLMVESMGYEGLFHAVKDYVQPVLLALAAVWMIGESGGSELSEAQRVAMLVGPVYVGLYVLSGIASRRAHAVSERLGSEERAARLIWCATGGLFGLIFAGSLLGIPGVVVGAFIGLHAAQNLWRPILVSRIDACSDGQRGATVLSIESQARRVATMVFAPVMEMLVDAARSGGGGGGVEEFWPIGAVGVGMVVLVVTWKRLKLPGNA